MKFSTRTTYGLRAMISLAENYGQGNLALSQISRDEKISLAYLERLIAKLKKAKLVKAEKGVNGGYKLTSKPKDTPVFDIVKTLEGKMSPFHCLDESGKIYCTDKCKCGVTGVLVKVQAAVNDSLKKMSLKDLI
jgi:Rrf2 family cysteine metabolism transcriptional repressor